jgi:drug/metabolite transporter (DMT)-like permease
MTDRRQHLDALAVTCLLACCLLWGLNQVAAKVALAEVPPLLQAGARSGVAALLVAAWARWRGIPLYQRDGTLRGGLLAGALFAAEFACIFVGLQFTTASRMVVFIYLAPFIVAVGMQVLVKSPGERLRTSQWFGLLGAFAGVAWAFAEGFQQPHQGPRQWIGDGLGVLAAVLWAGTTLTIRGSRLTLASAEKTLLYQVGVSAVLLLAAGLLQGERWPAHISATGWWSLGFQAVIVTFASYLMWFWLVRHYAATRLSAFTLLTPVFGLLAGVLMLGEPMTLRLGVALGAVTLGLAIVNRR